MRVYRWLLRLSPKALRRDYGAAMEDMFSRRLVEARRQGKRRVAHLWAREFTGLLVLAISERLKGGPEGPPLRDLSRPKAGIMDVTAQEIWQAARRLVRTPLFTATAALTLALAIAANASIFTVVNRVVVNPLPYPESDHLIALDYGLPARNIASGMNSMAWALYFHLTDHARTLQRVAVYDSGAGTLTGAGAPERLQVTRATPSLGSVLGVQPAIGRWFIEQEGVTGAAPVAVLSHGLWTRRFGANPNVVGQSIVFEGLSTEVVGVMPATFSFPNATTDMWMPAQSIRANASFLFTLSGIARLQDGASIENVRTEITALIKDLSRTVPNQAGIVSAAIPLQESLVGRIASALWTLMAAVALVLLVACANVANLFLVRSETRQREVAIRRALGAGRRSVARYFFAESGLLSLAGGVLGFALAWVGIQLLVTFGPASLPRLNEVRLDIVTIAFTIGLTILAALIFGVIPILRLAPVAPSLHENGRSQSPTRGSHRARQFLMGAQVALALVLLVASGLMVRSFQKLRAVDPGFNPASTLTFNIGLPRTKYQTRQAAADVHSNILDRLSALPGVTNASATTCLPLAGPCYGNGFLVDGEVRDLARPRPFVFTGFRAVGAGYIEAMGMRLLRGRSLERQDIDRGEPVIVINKAFAETYFPGKDPIDQRVKSVTLRSLSPQPPWLKIVGVVDNTSTIALGERTPWPQMFMPMSIAGGPEIPREALIGPDVTMMSYVVRSTTPAADIANAVRKAIDGVDPDLALAQVRTLEEIVDRASDQMTFTMVLLVIAAAVALLLGIIGIYGVVSYIVAQRTGEIGVRLAMGAEPRTVAGMILRQGGVVTLVGVAVGLVAAIAGSRLIQSLLYDVGPRDPVIFATTTVALLGIALLACWLPARRASKLSPLDALRTD
jgi:putative ABC transport system permease protein